MCPPASGAVVADLVAILETYLLPVPLEEQSIAGLSFHLSSFFSFAFAFIFVFSFAFALVVFRWGLLAPQACLILILFPFK